MPSAVRLVGHVSLSGDMRSVSLSLRRSRLARRESWRLATGPAAAKQLSGPGWSRVRLVPPRAAPGDFVVLAPPAFPHLNPSNRPPERDDDLVVAVGRGNNRAVRESGTAVNNGGRQQTRCGSSRRLTRERRQVQPTLRGIRVSPPGPMDECAGPALGVAHPRYSQGLEISPSIGFLTSGWISS